MGETVGGPDRETSSSERQQQRCGGEGGELSIRRHKLMWENIPEGWNKLFLEWQLSPRQSSQQKRRDAVTPFMSAAGVYDLILNFHNTVWVPGARWGEGCGRTLSGWLTCIALGLSAV